MQKTEEINDKNYENLNSWLRVTHRQGPKLRAWNFDKNKNYHLEVEHY